MVDGKQVYNDMDYGNQESTRGRDGEERRKGAGEEAVEKAQKGNSESGRGGPVEGQGFVYFIETEDQRFVKIGYSKREAEGNEEAMTRSEAEKTARENVVIQAALHGALNLSDNVVDAILEAVAREREECAKIADVPKFCSSGCGHEGCKARKKIAAEIRARKA